MTGYFSSKTIFLLPLVSVGFNFFLFVTQNFDFLYRVNANEPLIAFFYFFWTNSWYISLFFFTTFVLLKNYFTLIPILPISLIWLTLLCLYFLENQNFWFSNHSFSVFNFFIHDYNALLFNNLNKYHPFFLYTSAQLTLLLLLFFSFHMWELEKNYFSTTSFRRAVLQNLKIGALWCLFALFLGSWWAQQESSWGGWWNWDASETLGLFLLLKIFFFRHYLVHSLRSFSKFSFFLYELVAFFFIILSYVLVQLSFELTSHNFGIKFFYFFNNNLLFVEWVYYFVFSSIIFLFNFIFLKTRYLTQARKFKILSRSLFSVSTKNLYTIFLLFILFYTLILSFSQPLSFFLWNFLSVNLLNFSSNYDFLLFLWSLLFLFLIFPFYFSFPIFFWLTLKSFTFYPAFAFFYFLNKKWQKSYFIHYMLVFFFLIELFSEYSWFLYETFYVRYNYTSVRSYFLRSDTPYYFLNFLFLEKMIFLKNSFFETHLLCLNNVFSFNGNNGFSYFSDSHVFINYIYINMNYKSNHLWHETLFLPLLWIVAWLVLLKLCVKEYYSQNCIIELSIKHSPLRFYLKIVYL